MTKELMKTMRVIHITRRRMALLSLMLGLVIGSALVLAGCFGGKTPEVITAATNEERLAFLTGLGWEAEPQPIETLDLQLPETLTDDWAAYAKLQEGQQLPFADFTGQNVKRYTYIITNYPGVSQGVQANLYLWGDQIIGGDIIVTGQGGFQTDLSFPQA